MRNEMKRCKTNNDLKPPRTIWNNLKPLKRLKATFYLKNLLAKGICLRFSIASQDSVQDGRYPLKDRKRDLWLGLWDLMLSYNLDLEPLGPYNREPLRQSKRSRLQLVFKISSVKNLGIFTQKHLRWCLFLYFLKKRLQHRCF